MAGSLGSAEGRLLIDISQAMANLQSLENRVKSLGNVGGDAFDPLSKSGSKLDALDTRLTGLNKNYGTVAKGALGLGVAVGAAFGLSINSAANFEQAMDGAGASLGGVGTDAGITKEQFADLNDTALEIGASTSASATEVAGVIDLLGKAGIDAEQILSGTAKGVVNVSEATGESLEQSASSVGALTNLFESTGISAEKMSDVIVNGMNASNASLSEFQTGITRLSPYIVQTGASFEESAGLIAYFNSQGFSAAEVGTSLTSAYTNLIAPTEDQAAAQERLGISVYDSKGQFVGFPAIMDQVKTATEGMSEADQAAAINALFGADARDVMSLALKEGGEPLQDYIDMMDESGTAAEASRQRMDNFKGSIEKLRGALESLMIVVGTPFLGPLKKLADGAAFLVDKLVQLPGPIRTFIAAMLGITGAVAAAAGAIVLFGPQAIAIARQMQGIFAAARLLIPALLGISAPILIIVAALALLAVAYKTNLFGFRDAINSLASSALGKLKAIAAGLQNFAAIVTQTFLLFRNAGQNPFEAAFNALGQGFDYAAKKVPALAGAFGAASDAMKKLAKVSSDVGDVISKGVSIYKQLRTVGLNPVAAALKAGGALIQNYANKFGPLSGAVLAAGKAMGFAGEFVQRASNYYKAFADHVNPIAAILKAVGATLGDLAGRFGPLSGAVSALGDAFMSLGKFVGDAADVLQALFKGDWGEALDEAKSAVSNLGDAYKNFGKAGIEALKGVWDALSGVDWGGVLSGIGSALSSFGSSVWDALSSAFSSVDWGSLASSAWDLAKAAFDNIADIADWTLDVGIPKLGGAVVGAFTTIWDWVKSGASWLAGTLGDAIPDFASWSIDVGIPTVAGAVVAAFTTLWDWVKQGASWLAGSILPDGFPDWDIDVPTPGIIGDIVGAFSSLWEWVKSKVPWLGGGDGGGTIDADALNPWDIDTPTPGVTGAIVGAFSSMWEWVKSKVSWLGDKIDCLISGFDIDVPSPSAIGDAIGQGYADLCDWAKAQIPWLADLGGSITQAFSIEVDAAIDLIGDIANWGGNLMSWIKKHATWLEQLGGTITQVLTVAINAAADLIGDIANWAGDMIAYLKKHAPWIGEIAPKIDVAAIIDGTVSVAEGLMSAVTTAVNGIVDAAQAIWDKAMGLKDWVLGGDDKEDGTQSSTQQAATAEQVAAILESAAASIQASSAAITTALSTIILAIDGFVTKVGLAGVNAGTQFNAGIGPGFTTAAATVTTALSGITLGIDGFVTTTGLSGVEAGNQFNTGISTGLGTAAASVTTFTSAMKSTISSFASDAGQQGSKAGSTFATGVQNGMQRASSAVQTAAGTMRGALSSLASAMGSAGQQGGSQFASGVQSGMGRAVGAAQTGANQIRSALNLGSLFGQGSSIGSSLGEGIAAGIRSQVGNIAAEAANAVNAAINAANAAAVINSPSKRTMKTGVGLGEGLEIGIMKKQDDVAKALGQLVPYDGLDALGRMRSMPMASGGGVVNNYTILALKSEEWIDYTQKAETGHDYAQRMTYLAGTRRR